MSGATFLTGDTIELKTLTEKDVEIVQRLLNDPQIRQPTDRYAPAYKSRVNQWISSRGEDDEINLLIYSGENPVGLINLFSIDDVFGLAEVGFGIIPEHWGNGYASDGLRTLCSYAFEERGLHKVYGNAFATNAGSQRVMEKVGFQEEGILREEAIEDGRRVDMHRYGLLAEEWLAD